MMKAVAAAVSLGLLATGAQAQTAKEQHELSALCGKQAAERFEKSWGKGEDELNHLRKSLQLPTEQVLLRGVD